jgi:hypothetical protein
MHVILVISQRTQGLVHFPQSLVPLSKYSGSHIHVGKFVVLPTATGSHSVHSPSLIQSKQF